MFTHSYQRVFTVSIKSVSFPIKCNVMPITVNCAGAMTQVCCTFPFSTITRARNTENICLNTEKSRFMCDLLNTAMCFPMYMDERYQWGKLALKTWPNHGLKQHLGLKRPSLVQLITQRLDLSIFDPTMITMCELGKHQAGSVKVLPGIAVHIDGFSRLVCHAVVSART